MIYLDNAATSYPKPKPVMEAIEECFKRAGSPGRGAHKMALAASRVILETRELLAELFNVKDPANIVFTLNATEAINLGLKGLLKPGDNVITTSMEHNAVTRPLKDLEAQGIKVTKIKCSHKGHLDLDDLRDSISHDTKLIVMTHASNVTGTLMPIEDVGEIARGKAIFFMVDAAQTAGIFPIDVQDMNIDLLAFCGHKGLLGPQGTGGLYINPDIDLKELKQGGTGGYSDDPFQPRIRPERYEAGTPNTPGIAGLGASLKFIRDIGLQSIHDLERDLTLHLLEGLRKMPRIKLYGPQAGEERAPVVSLNVEGMNPHEVEFILDQAFDITVRSGLHCAPDAHRTIGTEGLGAVRFSMGYFNTMEDIDQAIETMRYICEKS
ncbi:MAG: aminotransferase class V-fold PLP-dependent enzyme [Actinomycetota bacterium]|nr:aminotransferase class V-fold PLP-dependent enzyme [Actinomycetota bacterium]